MNNLLKEKMRIYKEQVKSLELKKKILKKKKRCRDFMEELENRGNENIESNKSKIEKLLKEVDACMIDNARVEEDIHRYTKEMEEYRVLEKSCLN